MDIAFVNCYGTVLNSSLINCKFKRIKKCDIFVFIISVACLYYYINLGYYTINIVVNQKVKRKQRNILIPYTL